MAGLGPIPTTKEHNDVSRYGNHGKVRSGQDGRDDGRPIRGRLRLWRPVPKARCPELAACLTPCNLGEPGWYRTNDPLIKSLTVVVSPAFPRFPKNAILGQCTDLKRPWNIARRLARLEVVRIHDLRHTLASHGRAAGLTLTLAGGLLGHKNVSTTPGYVHLWGDPLKDAAHRAGRRIEDAMAGKTSHDKTDLNKPGRKGSNVVTLRRRKA